MSSKRTSFTELTGKKKLAEDEPAAPPVSALLHTITGNPDNPRDDDDLDLDELVESFREVGQLQPVLAVSRAVYLKHKPGNAKAIGDAQYVTIGGNRRLLAARELGWARIDIVVRDDLGNGEGALDEAVIIENIHRKNLSTMREAAFLQILFERYGSQGKVAKKIGKTQPYVSQRLALLKLEPDLQAAVDSGQVKVKEARKIAAVPAAEQKAALQRHQEDRATYNPVMGGPGSGSLSTNADGKGQESPASSPSKAPAVPQATGIPSQERTSARPPAVEAPPSQAGPGVSLDDVAWQDPGAVRELIMEWMAPGPRAQLVALLMKDMDEQTA